MARSWVILTVQPPHRLRWVTRTCTRNSKKALVDAAFAKLKGFCPDQVGRKPEYRTKPSLKEFVMAIVEVKVPSCLNPVAEATMLTWKKKKPVKLLPPMKS